MENNFVELVSPAGDWPSLVTAIDSGADSVYFGIKGLNMRNEAANFDISELNKIMAFLHRHKKKGYLALNVIVMNKELTKVEKILKSAKSADVDAVVCWDLAVLSIAKKLGLKIHLSTQAGVSNIESVLTFHNLGVRRIVLARECSLDDVQEITHYLKKKNINCEIETFIHGAMCVSISGRCFLSHYAFGKSANRGECLQPCRRKFLIQDMDSKTEYVLGEDYILSAKDLCAIDFIDELIKSGISAFKIEGRMRSPEYVKITTSVYREAIDAFSEKRLTSALKKELKEQLSKVYNRGFSSGFYFGAPVDGINAELKNTYEKIFLGEVRRFYKKISVAEIIIQNGPLAKGAEILFTGKNTPASITRIEELQQNHRFIERADKGSAVGVKLSFAVKPKDKVFIWKRRDVLYA